MTAQIANIPSDQIKALLAERGYEVSEPTPGVLRIQDVHSGVSVRAVPQGEILYLSLTCTVVPERALTREIMAAMLDAHNGISTSYFQLYQAGDGNVAITLNNFCKLESSTELGPEDQDDILSCVHFLLVDVLAARRILSGLPQ
jgi:hypothetical protein